MLKKARVFAVDCFVVIAYYTGLVSLFYLLNRKRKRIVVFHNVLPDELFVDNIAEFVSDPVSRFRWIIREIGKHFRFSADVLDANTATITFDDGYLNQYEIASKVLAEEGNIPGVIFTAGMNIDNQDAMHALVVDRLIVWTAHVPNGEYVLKDGTRIVASTGNRAYLWHNIVMPKFLTDSISRGEFVFSMFDAAYSFKKILEKLPQEYVRLRLHGMKTYQIKELRDKGWKIGWHTFSHFALSYLSTDDQRKELIPPDDEFKHTVFSYPYGGLKQVNLNSIHIVEECGYPCAVSSCGVRTHLMGLFFIPRDGLNDGKFRLHYRLSGLRHFLIHHRLLPSL